MGNPKFIGCDVSQITYSFRDGSDPAFPISNLKTYFNDNIAKSNATTGVTRDLIFDLGAPATCSCMVISGSNADGGDSYVYYSTNGSTYTTVGATAAINSSAGIIMTFPAISARYWRFSTGGVPSALSIGNAFIGTPLTFENSYDWDYSFGNKSFETNKAISLDGRLRAAQAFGGRKLYDLTFQTQSDTLAAAFKSFVDTVRGDLRPFYFIDDDGLTADYVYFSESYEDLRRKKFNLNSVSIKLQSQLTT